MNAVCLLANQIRGFIWRKAMCFCMNHEECTICTNCTVCCHCSQSVQEFRIQQNIVQTIIFQSVHWDYTIAFLSSVCHCASCVCPKASSVCLCASSVCLYSFPVSLCFLCLSLFLSCVCLYAFFVCL